MEDPLVPDRVEFVYAFQASTFAGERGAPARFLDTAVSESLKVPATVWKQVLEEMLVEDHTGLHVEWPQEFVADLEAFAK